jgi:hypothetical protein
VRRFALITELTPQPPTLRAGAKLTGAIVLPLFQPDIVAPSARVIVVAPSQIVVVTTVLRVETHDRLDGPQMIGHAAFLVAASLVLNVAQGYPPLLISVLADVNQVLEVVAFIFQETEPLTDFRQ